MKLTSVIFVSLAVILAATVALLYRSGIHVAGYSMLLWNIPEQKLLDGDIVPVYTVKSNISHVCIIGLPSDKKKKIEVPLWQLTEPLPMSKTKKLSLRYEEYAHQYAKAALDGLPVRSEPESVSKQIYRLRRDEIVKLLYKGAGMPVMAGGKQLEGDWLMVLTHDGTQGWCFSNNLRQFSLDRSGMPVEEKNAAAGVEKDDTLDDMMNKKWYPEYYLDMIQSGSIDISAMSSSYGFDTGVSGTVGLATPDISVSKPYTGIEKTGRNVYSYNGTSFVVTVQSPDNIVVRYTGTDGKPRNYNMVSLLENIEDIVAAETERREGELLTIREHSRVYSSSNYGTLSLYDDDSFIWAGHNLLSPFPIPYEAGNTGFIEIQYFLDNSLRLLYDGVLTFNFYGDQSSVNFLYKIEDDGLRIEDASGANIDRKTIKARGNSPLVIFFER